ncbi:PREDICTED: uncharacterized protein C11orf24 homolog [Tinamus guttatus]|uniref:uncharacterized protein C11orf24 homolog n=1 Tax=Tinamus guttatus TaxID=94827 RepID=UPI00052E6F00|nr:PREDICTED: uncharacterized protein C11orf24 homolog [Tinamus guttatus]
MGVNPGSRISVLRERGARVVRVSRLTTEKQCRRACKGPAASGNRHCNWSVPYQNRCLLLRCRKLSVCQSAGEQDIHDLLGEIVLRKRRTDLFHHQRYPEQMEKTVNAVVDQHSTENLLSSTTWTVRIHSRQLLNVESGAGTADAGKTTAVNAATTTDTASTAAAATTIGTNASISSAVPVTSVKATTAPVGGALKSIFSTASSLTHNTITASVTNNVTKLVTTAEKSGNKSAGSVSESPSPPPTAEPGTGPQVTPEQRSSPAPSTASASRPGNATAAGGHSQVPSTSTTATTLTPLDAQASATAAARATALATSVSSHSSNPAPTVTSPNPGPEGSTATTSWNKLTSFLSSTSAMVSTTAPATEATTGHETKSVSPIASTGQMTTAPANAPATTAPATAGAQGTDEEYLLIAAEPLTHYLVDKSSLLAVLLFGTVFFITVIVVFLMQAYESYKKKDYTQVDYLINGMYVDSEM